MPRHALPADCFALPEQNIRGPIREVMTTELSADGDERIRSEADIYAAKADLITVRHRHGDVVAVIEIVSPGNKSSRAEFGAFVQKSAGLIRQNVHLLVVDLFPPGPRDPHGIHKAIWDEFLEEEYDSPRDKPLTLAAYDAGPPRVAYVEPFAVGDSLPNMPVFLKPETYVPAPLEATDQTTWSTFPAAVKGLLEDPPV